jgi:hypothetical protein
LKFSRKGRAIQSQQPSRLRLSFGNGQRVTEECKLKLIFALVKIAAVRADGCHRALIRLVQRVHLALLVDPRLNQPNSGSA